MSYLEKTLARLGFELTFNPPGDGDCLFSSAASLESKARASIIKTLVLDYLKNHLFDVSIFFFSFILYTL